MESNLQDEDLDNSLGLENESENSSFRSEVQELSAERIKAILRKRPQEVAIRFASGICGYYVIAEEEREMKVVYAGPNGPENKPARISMENLRMLKAESEEIRFEHIENTPFTSSLIKNS